MRPSVTITYSFPSGIKPPSKGPAVKGAEADSDGSSSGSDSEEQQAGDTRAFGEDVYASEVPEVQEQAEPGWYVPGLSQSLYLCFYVHVHCVGMHAFVLKCFCAWMRVRAWSQQACPRAPGPPRGAFPHRA